MNEDIDTNLLDEIGPWTDLKHAITTYYAGLHSKILGQAKGVSPKFHRTYIDGFAAAGYNIRKNSRDIVEGSALQVLRQADFDKYTFVEMDSERHQHLSQHCRTQRNVEIIKGDANLVLTQLVFPRIRYDQYQRAFCLLDPYNETGLSWNTIVAAADTKAIDLLVHFPIMSINRNVLRRGKNYTTAQAKRLSHLWGDETWESAAYTSGNMLFADMNEKADNAAFVGAFCKRLESVAGFLGVSKPIPMKNGRNNVIYYLVFASNNRKGVEVITQTANKFIRVPQPFKVLPTRLIDDAAG